MGGSLADSVVVPAIENHRELLVPPLAKKVCYCLHLNHSVEDLGRLPCGKFNIAIYIFFLIGE